MFSLKEIKRLWFECYGEDLKVDYSAFFKMLKDLEKNKNSQLKNN